ncbi:MAG: DUF5103 domain-containing protein [Flavobacteriales bacterium]
MSCGGEKKVSSFNTDLYENEIDSIDLNLETTDSEEEQVNYLFENAIYQPSIKTVLLHPSGNELGLPMMKLSLNDTLLLSFDDLSREPRNYYFTLIHCNADWSPSDLMQNEYLEGFFEEPITDYSFSFNTIQAYTHYKTTIPSSQLRPILSGNYLLIVYPEGQKEYPILSKRLMVINKKVNISATVKRATDLEQRNFQHEIDFSIRHAGYNIDNPFSDIKTVISQNGRWDNAITDLQAVFVKNQEIIYDFEEENCFDGGNEYRFFDIQSLRFLSERLINISYQNDTNKVMLRSDYARPFKRYSNFVQDINGRCLVRVQEGNDNAIEADYALVKFTLPYDHNITHGELYVFGQISDYGFPESHKMIFNFEQKQYERSIYLKQGYYNYEYVLKKNDGKTINRFIEGTHYQTVNDYYIYIYHRQSGELYDQLIGVEKLTSKDLL